MPAQGNILSILALLLWIPVSLWAARRWPPARAAALLFVGALMFLPEKVAFKLPAMPEFGKAEITSFWLAVAMLAFHRHRLLSVPLTRTLKIILAFLVVGPALTVLLNRDYITYGSVALPGHGPYDVVHAVSGVFLTAALPFLMGAALFRRAEDLRVLFRVLVGGALIYTLLEIVELILSPQLHRWIYGFHPHDFVQMMRGGGYRPMVFMGHGLTVSMFTLQGAIASSALHRLRNRVFRLPTLVTTSWLMFIVAITRSVAPFVYGLVGVPLALFSSPKTQVRVAALLGMIVLSYPMLRAADLVPIDAIGELATAQFGEERSSSLMFRLKNEDVLMERARERAWFGWGLYCRGCIFEPWSGEPISVFDGEWIVAMNTFGIVGFIGRFGVLIFPILFCWRQLGRARRKPDQILLANLALLLGFSAVNLIPNSTNFLTFVLSGALFGGTAGAVREAAVHRAKKRAARAASLRPAAAGAAALLLLPLLAGSARALPKDAVGGGSTDGGLLGTYYANPDFEAKPAFVRRDVRIDFRGGDQSSVAGSTSPGFRDFPGRGFSVRWAGAVLPRFSESYSFVGEATGVLRVRVRGPGETEWTVLLEHAGSDEPVESDPIRFSAGQRYELEVEYRAPSTGESTCRLMWKSKSTPLEVVDPVVQHGFNAGSWQGYVWADLVRSARYGDPSYVDREGWPKKSGAELVASEMSEIEPDLAGSYLLQFRGQAEVEQRCCNQALFSVGDARWERVLPVGAGYDRTTNTTSARMSVDGSRFMLHFNRARRSPGEQDTGVTDIRLMRPVRMGSTQHHDPGEIVYRPFKEAISPYFTTIRWLSGANGDTSGDWDERTRPDYAFFAMENGQENWESLVMLANETGRDLYITTPVAADDEYFRKLAQLLRYGSDGKEPYSAPTPNPKYPPLSSHLRVYVEVGNEIWNWAFPSTQVAQRISKAESDAGSDVWKAMNFDGDVGHPEHAGAIRRWHALRTLACSRAFREVFGDAQMGARVRMVLEYQYDNYQDTAILSLDFLDRYLKYEALGRGDEAQPVSYHLWGAGGATYYGLANKKGTQDGIVLRDPSFEATELAPGTLATKPQKSAWQFEGLSGVVRPGESRRVEALERLPPPKAGEQAAFLRGRAEIRQRVRFDKPGTYALGFRAAGSGKDWPGHLPFDVYVGSRKVSPRGQIDVRVSERDAVLAGWGRSTTSLEEEWGSAPFVIEAPSEETIRFVGRGNDDDYLLIDDVYVASVDAIMESGFDAGEALGQVADAEYARQLRGQASYARAFGLEVVGYEAGWSLGGDFHQLPIQTWAKFYDPRTREINNRAIELWYRSGSFMNVWGVFTYWPSYDFDDVDEYAVMQSLRDSVRTLPPEATYGTPLPAKLAMNDADLSHDTRLDVEESCTFLRWLPWFGGARYSWRSWMVVAPETAPYTLSVEGRGSGTVIVEVDGQEAVRLDSLDASTPSVEVLLPKGAHSVRAVTWGDDVELSAIHIRK